METTPFTRLTTSSLMVGLAAGAVIVAGVVLGGRLGAAAVDEPPHAAAPALADAPSPPDTAVVVPPEGVTASGERYGSGAGFDDPADAPDLILAYATNGAIGYVKKSDLFADQASTPEEATAIMAAKAKAAEGVRDAAGNPVHDVGRAIDVYDLSGQRIGEFIVRGGGGGDITR